MQTNLFEQLTQHQQIFPDCWIVRNVANLSFQKMLIAQCREWVKNRLVLNSFSMGYSPSIEGYIQSDFAFQRPVEALHYRALNACPDRATRSFVDVFHGPDTATIKWHIGDTQSSIKTDDLEDLELLKQGSPIVLTIIGDRVTVQVSESQVEMFSGDSLILFGKSRSRPYGLVKVHEGTAPDELGLKRHGTISINSKRAKYISDK